MIDTAEYILLSFLVGISFTELYLVWRQHGPLAGTVKQRLKCAAGFHDYRLLAFTTDPWRLIWRCHWCWYEHLTPDTHADRVELDRQMPAVQQPATGRTVPLDPGAAA